MAGAVAAGRGGAGPGGAWPAGLVPSSRLRASGSACASAQRASRGGPQPPAATNQRRRGGGTEAWNPEKAPATGESQLERRARRPIGGEESESPERGAWRVRDLKALGNRLRSALCASLTGAVGRLGKFLVGSDGVCEPWPRLDREQSWAFRGRLVSKAAGAAPSPGTVSSGDVVGGSHAERWGARAAGASRGSGLGLRCVQKRWGVLTRRCPRRGRSAQCQGHGGDPESGQPAALLSVANTSGKPKPRLMHVSGFALSSKTAKVRFVKH